MGWIKLDDAFLDHPKFLEAGPLAGYLCICGIAWSNRNRTDGKIPRNQVRRFVDFEGFGHHIWSSDVVGGGEDVDAMGLAEELVNIGLWDRDGRDYRVHDYHDYQRSSDEISAAIEQRREAGKRGGRARRASTSPSESLGESSSGSVSEIKARSQAEGRRKKEEPTPPNPLKRGNRKRDVQRHENDLRSFAATLFGTACSEDQFQAVKGAWNSGARDRHAVMSWIGHWRPDLGGAA